MFSFGLLWLILLFRAESAEVQFKDINLLVVTDAHSWISRHFHDDHRPPLDADFGDIASAVSHVKALATRAGKDVFFVNNGDHVEGSGLSDASVYTTGIHGYDLFPLISMMPFDALTIGNHDLYDDATISYMKHESNFIEGWNGRYLTSNTLNATTQEPMGTRYVILTGPNAGTKVLFFGFLYHMTDSCTSVVVQDPRETVQEAWFKEALREGQRQGVQAIVVLSHMDVKDENVYVVQAAIREFSATIPLQFITGHTHYRGWEKIDSYSSSFEAGHYLDTLGYICFDVPAPAPQQAYDPAIYFAYKYVEANRATLMDFTGTDEASFPTAQGAAITKAIDETVERLGLREVLGCPTTNYSYSAPLGASDSLYSLYIDKVIPMGLFDIPTGTGNVPYYVTSTGSLRYNVFEGEFIYDDVFALAPFTNLFLFYPGLSGADATTVLTKLMSIPPHLPLSWQTKDSLPSFVGGPGRPASTARYDLFFNEFDGPKVTQAIAEVVGSSQSSIEQKSVAWRQDGEDLVDTTLVWKNGVGDIWPCN